MWEAIEGDWHPQGITGRGYLATHALGCRSDEGHVVESSTAWIERVIKLVA
jgi:hypothetical protein